MSVCGEPFPWDDSVIWEPATCNREFGHDEPHRAEVTWFDLTDWSELDDE